MITHCFVEQQWGNGQTVGLSNQFRWKLFPARFPMKVFLQEHTHHDRSILLDSHRPEDVEVETVFAHGACFVVQLLLKAQLGVVRGIQEACEMHI